MNLLHISDLHIGKRINEYLLNDSIANALNQIVEQILFNKIDCLLISGDIFDKAIPSIEATKEFDTFLSKLTKLNIHTFIIPGNHDSKERLAYLKGILQEHNIYIAYDKLEVVTIENYDFYLMPYLNLYELRDLYNMNFKTKDEAYKHIFDIEFKNEKNILLLHDYVSYPNLELSDSERPLSIGGSDYVDFTIFNSFDYVALGHIHKCQKITDRMYYSGSIAKYSFSEENNKNSSILIDSDFNIKRLYLNDYVKLHTIKGKLNELIQKEFYQNYNVDTDLFRAIITDDDEVIGVSFKLKGIYKNLITIEYTRSYNPVTISNSPDKPILDLFLDFFKYIETKDISKEDKDVLVNILNQMEVA